MSRGFIPPGPSTVVPAVMAQFERLWRGTHDSFPDTFAVAIDLQGRQLKVWVSSDAAERYGVTAEQVEASSLEDIFGPEKAAELMAGLERTVAEDTPQRAEMVARLPNGRFWQEVTGLPVKSEDGIPLGVVAFVRDITSRKELEESLRQTSHKYQVLVERSSDAILVVRENRVMYQNPAATRLLDSGLRAGALVEQVLAALAATPESAAQEVALVSPGGRELVLEAEQHHIQLGGDPAVMLVLHDITEHRQRESERIRAQKLESLGVLAGGIAHDFNNILMTLGGSVELALRQPEDAGAVRGHLQRARGALDQARRLTGQLLTFAKGGAPVRQVLDVDEVIRSAADLMMRGAAVRCDVRIESDVWRIHADPGQIQQVLGNLLINAIQAMPRGGVVTLSARNVQPELARVEAAALQPGRYVRLDVEDSGPGIAEADLSRIFDPWFSTKAGGTGLGLAVVHSVVTRHGGHITVKSELGKGTLFTIYLPAASERSVESASVAAQGVAMGCDATGVCRALVMDDEPAVRDVAEHMLRKLGCDVVSVEDGATALAAFERAVAEGKPFDVALLDLTVPGGMGGVDVAARMRALHPAVRLVVSSGYANAPVVAAHREHGFDDVLRKPYTLADLRAVLR